MSSKNLGSITVPAGESRNNMQGTAASLDLSTKTTRCDSVIEAVSGGTGGNALTIAFAVNAGMALTITRSSSAFTVHYHDGVSTVTDFETALSALTGSDALIRLRTAGTGANILAAPGDTFTATHLAGGADDAFAIPRGAKMIEILTSANDVTYRVLPDPASFLPFNPAAYVPPFATPSTVAATADDPGLDGGFVKPVAIGDYGCPSVVAVRSTGGATVSIDLAELD